MWIINSSMADSSFDCIHLFALPANLQSVREGQELTAAANRDKLNLENKRASEKKTTDVG